MNSEERESAMRKSSDIKYRLVCVIATVDLTLKPCHMFNVVFVDKSTDAPLPYHPYTHPNRVSKNVSTVKRVGGLRC